MADSSLRFTLRKPHVLQFFHSEMAALRTSERARKVHRARELRDQDDNKVAAVQALKTLEQMADAAVRHPGSQSVAGLVIVIRTGGSAPDKLIGPAAPPVIDAESVRLEQSNQTRESCPAWGWIV